MHQLNPLSSESGTLGQEPEDSLQNASDQQQAATAQDPAKSRNLLAEHKGKLAVGAAAMLGIAIFYKWRENRLAKEDPEQYARLQRLKSAVRTDES